MSGPLDGAGSLHVDIVPRESYDAALAEAKKALDIGVFEQSNSICDTKNAEVRPTKKQRQASVSEVAAAARGFPAVLGNAVTAASSLAPSLAAAAAAAVGRGYAVQLCCGGSSASSSSQSAAAVLPQRPPPPPPSPAPERGTAGSSRLAGLAGNGAAEAGPRVISTQHLREPRNEPLLVAAAAPDIPLPSTNELDHNPCQPIFISGAEVVVVGTREPLPLEPNQPPPALSEQFNLCISGLVGEGGNGTIWKVNRSSSSRGASSSSSSSSSNMPPEMALKVCSRYSDHGED